MVKRHNDAPGPKGWGEEVTSTEPRLHICKRTDDPRRTKGIGQHVYELTPTLLLNNPLLNPVHTQDPNYFPPAPLNHRTSMGNSSYSGGAYPSDSGPYTMDRQSVSSASTTTYPTGPNGFSNPSMTGFTPQPNMLTPMGRRTSEMSTPSLPSAPGGSGFEMPTVYQNEVRGDYEYFNRGSREYDRASYQPSQPGMPQRHSSNEWTSPALTAGSTDPFDQYGAGYAAAQQWAQSGYGAQQQQTPTPGRPQYQTQLSGGGHDYAQVSQAAEYPQAGYPHQAQQQQYGAGNGTAYQHQQGQGYQGGGHQQQQGYFRQ